MILQDFLHLGGKFAPLIVSKDVMKGVSLFNPSIVVHNGQVLVNIRNGNYTLWHSDQTEKIPHIHGPLVYIHPENELKLKTENIIAEINPQTLQIIPGTAHVIEMAMDDPKKPPVWDFHGLEDVRLVFWNNRICAIGVRRDVKEDGQGRMEISDLHSVSMRYTEVGRYRIELPDNYSPSYCEKNWMPIEDKPLHFVKWTNPTIIIKYDPLNRKSFEFLNKTQTIPSGPDLRGSSQVIRIGDYRMAIVHETHLFKTELGQKDARYYHRIVAWDMDWNIVALTKADTFFGFGVEYCCGMVCHNHEVFITFSVQDNAAFVVKVPVQKFIEYVIK